MKMVTNIGTMIHHSQSPVHNMNVTAAATTTPATSSTPSATSSSNCSLTNIMASSQIPTTNNNNNNEPIIIKQRSASDNRRSNKPIMEKRRRARINNCLNDLKTLILDATKKDPARHSKLEKADILEKTVKHLQDLQRQQATIAKLNDPTMINKYKSGFTECIKEVGRFPDIDQQLKRRLIQHLTDCINGTKLDLSLSLPCSPTSSTPPLPPQPPIQISTIPSLTITTAPSPSAHLSSISGTSLQHSQQMQLQPQPQHQQQHLQHQQRLSPSAIALTPVIQPVQIHMLQSPGQTLTSKLSNIQQGQSQINFPKHQQQSQLLQLPQQHSHPQQSHQQQQQQHQQQQQQILQLSSATNGYFVKLSYVPSGPNQQLPNQQSNDVHLQHLLPISHNQQPQQQQQHQQHQQHHQHQQQIMQTQTILPTLVPIPIRTSSTASSTSNFSSTSDRLSIDNSMINSSRCYTPLSPPNSCGEIIDYQMIPSKTNNINNNNNNENEHQQMIDMNNNNTNNNTNNNINGGDILMDDDLSIRSDSPQPISLVMKKSRDMDMDVQQQQQQQQQQSQHQQIMNVSNNYNQMYCNYGQQDEYKDGQHWRPW